MWSCDCKIYFADRNAVEIKNVTEISFQTGGGYGPKTIKGEEILTYCIPLDATLWFRASGKNVCVKPEGIQRLEVSGSSL